MHVAERQVCTKFRLVGLSQPSVRMPRSHGAVFQGQGIDGETVDLDACCQEADPDVWGKRRRQLLHEARTLCRLGGSHSERHPQATARRRVA